MGTWGRFALSPSVPFCEVIGLQRLMAATPEEARAALAENYLLAALGRETVALDAAVGDQWAPGTYGNEAPLPATVLLDLAKTFADKSQISEAMLGTLLAVKDNTTKSPLAMEALKPLIDKYAHEIFWRELLPAVIAERAAATGREAFVASGFLMSDISGVGIDTTAYDADSLVGGRNKFTGVELAPGVVTPYVEPAKQVIGEDGKTLSPQAGSTTPVVTVAATPKGIDSKDMIEVDVNGCVTENGRKICHPWLLPANKTLLSDSSPNPLAATAGIAGSTGVYDDGDKFWISEAQWERLKSSDPAILALQQEGKVANVLRGIGDPAASRLLVERAVLAARNALVDAQRPCVAGGKKPCEIDLSANADVQWLAAMGNTPEMTSILMGLKMMDNGVTWSEEVKFDDPGVIARWERIDRALAAVPFFLTSPPADKVEGKGIMAGQEAFNKFFGHADAVDEKTGRLDRVRWSPAALWDDYEPKFAEVLGLSSGMTNVQSGDGSWGKQTSNIGPQYNLGSHRAKGNFLLTRQDQEQLWRRHVQPIIDKTDNAGKAAAAQKESWAANAANTTALTQTILEGEITGRITWPVRSDFEHALGSLTNEVNRRLDQYKQDNRTKFERDIDRAFSDPLIAPERKAQEARDLLVLWDSWAEGGASNDPYGELQRRAEAVKQDGGAILP
jgi:hypothetical protein